MLFFFEPKPGIAGADFTVDGGGFDVFGFLAEDGGNPFAERGGGDGENQSELRQDQQQFLVLMPLALMTVRSAAGGKLAEGDDPPMRTARGMSS